MRKSGLPEYVIDGLVETFAALREGQLRIAAMIMNKDVGFGADKSAYWAA